MAYLDDRIWCHPKIAGLPKASRWTYAAAIAYSSGFSTAGVLDAGQQRMIGADAKDRRLLIESGLWDELGDGTVRIHDWDDYNGKRDARKAADRERKRQERAAASAGQSADKPADSPQQIHGTDDTVSAGQPSDGPRVRARARPPDDGSEGSEGTSLPSSGAVTHYDSNGTTLTLIKTTIDESLAEAAAKR